MGVLLGVPKRTIEIIEYENHGRAEEILCVSIAWQCVRRKTMIGVNKEKQNLMLDAAIYNGKAYRFDAAPIINHPGRYINHAHRNASLLLKKPVWIGAPPKV